MSSIMPMLIFRRDLLKRDQYKLYESMLPLRSKKTGEFEKLLGCTQWVSRAPPHHTLPAFLNLDGGSSIRKI